MIQFKTGNLLTEDVEALVNSVNCVGVMGRGIALQFRNVFPANYQAYAEACKRHEVKPGQMLVYETGQLTNPRYIINFPTKRHWKGKSRMEDIDAGLVALVDVIRQRNIQSIAIPPLGSGLGGLEWRAVRERIEAALQGLDDRQVIIYEPSDVTSDARANYSRNVPHMTVGRAALVGLIDRYLRGLLDPFVTLLEVHKLMYFLQETGEPLRLRYVKGIYGPYAENLRHVMNEIEGHLIVGYADGGDAPDKQLELVPGALEETSAFLHDRNHTLARLAKVSALVEGFESPFGLELLATVHWIATREPVQSKDDVIMQTYAWNERKRQFSRRQIGLAMEVLSNKDWMGGRRF
ncbi:MAG: macro domain-containing protein [Caldilinea sp.]|nr:macro domain-containing protein [Caldilinea sp.]